MGWVPGPATVPAALVGAAAMPAGDAAAARGVVAVAAVVLAGGAGAATVSVTLFSAFPPLEH